MRGGEIQAEGGREALPAYLRSKNPRLERPREPQASSRERERAREREEVAAVSEQFLGAVTLGEQPGLYTLAPRCIGGDARVTSGAEPDLCDHFSRIRIA